MPAEPADPNTLAGPVDLDATKLAAARLWAAHRFPYLATALFASPVVAAPGSGQVSIDRWWRVHADPSVVAGADVAGLGGELLHLCAHVLRDHAERADRAGLGQPAELHHWVEAADAEIDDDFPADLARIRPRIGAGDLDSPPGRLAEEYYRSGSVRPGSTADCGSGAHGQPALDEPPPDDRTRPGVSREQQEMLRRRVADEVARAEGAVPPGLRTWARNRLHQPADWRRELAAVVRRSLASVGGAVDYSYRRPSRRAASVTGVVLPSLRQPVVEVAVVCDTSASVTDAQLGTALGEVDAVLRATGTRSVRLLACDDAVRSVSRVSPGREVHLLGGGGTDLTVAIDEAMALRPPVQAVVVLTDGHTPWPDRPPRAEVVVGLLEGDRSLPRPPDPPPWARVVVIPAPR
ncbi:MAG: VWA-like domain-containing protein [Acidimicrobiales bacterium]